MAPDKMKKSWKSNVCNKKITSAITIYTDIVMSLKSALYALYMLHAH